jgi:very-short-patch-repair endonuclease
MLSQNTKSFAKPPPPLFLGEAGRGKIPEAGRGKYGGRMGKIILLYKNNPYIRIMSPITQFCRQLRNNQTPAEKTLWEVIRKRHIGGEKFLRQFPIFIIQGLNKKTYYIADFYCAKYKLVIEVDGPIHLLKKEYDDNRDLVMKEWGFDILRFTNDEVFDDLDTVIQKLDEYLLAYNIR